MLLFVGILVLFAILRTFSAAWYILRFYGYRLEAHGESLHVRCGLLTQVSATIPRGRVQLISKRYCRTDWGLIVRSGTWNQKCSMTFFEKIQSVSYSQSPFDRRWHMANLSVDTAAAGPAEHRIQIGYLDSEFAAVEFEKIEEALPSH